MRKKNNSKKQLTVIVIVFAIVLIAGVVYAALTGTLTFTGTTTLYSSSELELQFVEASETSTSTNGSVATLSLEPVDGIPNQRARIEAVFVAEDDAVEFEFKVKNFGTAPAVITYIPMLDPDVWNIVIVGGTFRNLENKVIQPGDTITNNGHPFTISIQMHGAQGEEIEPGKAYEFEIGMEYEAAP